MSYISLSLRPLSHPAPRSAVDTSRNARRYATSGPIDQAHGLRHAPTKLEPRWCRTPSSQARSNGQWTMLPPLCGATQRPLPTALCARRVAVALKPYNHITSFSFINTLNKMYALEYCHCHIRIILCICMYIRRLSLSAACYATSRKKPHTSTSLRWQRRLRGHRRHRRRLRSRRRRRRRRLRGRRRRRLRGRRRRRRREQRGDSH